MFEWLSRILIKQVEKEDSNKDNICFWFSKEKFNNFYNLKTEEKELFLKNIIYFGRLELLKSIKPYIRGDEVIINDGISGTLFDYSLAVEDLDIANYLLDNNLFDVKKIDSQGNHALLTAIKYPHKNYKISNIIQKIVRKGALINTPNNKEEYPLYLMIQRGDYLMVEEMLERGAQPYLIDNLLIDLDKNRKQFGIYRYLLKSYDVDRNLKFLNLDYHNVSFNNHKLIFKTESKSIGETFSISNKRILKKIDENKLMGNKFNSILFNLLFLIKESFEDIDDQLLEPMVLNYENKLYGELNQEDVKSIVQLLRFFNKKRVVSLMSYLSEDPEDLNYLKLAGMALKKIQPLVIENKLDIFKILPKKPKKFKEIYVKININLLKLEQVNKRLNQEDIEFLDGQKWEGFLLEVPSESYDLIHLGTNLNICIGNGFYASRITEKDSFLIVLKKDNKPIYCVQFDKNSLIQAKGKNNKIMPKQLEKKLEIMLLSIFY